MHVHRHVPDYYILIISLKEAFSLCKICYTFFTKHSDLILVCDTLHYHIFFVRFTSSTSSLERILFIVENHH